MSERQREIPISDLEQLLMEEYTKQDQEVKEMFDLAGSEPLVQDFASVKWEKARQRREEVVEIAELINNRFGVSINLTRPNVSIPSETIRQQPE